MNQIIRFCFIIALAAGVYGGSVVQHSFIVSTDQPAAEIIELNQEHVRNGIAAQMGIDPELIQAISKEEYEAYVDEFEAMDDGLGDEYTEDEGPFIWNP